MKYALIAFFTLSPAVFSAPVTDPFGGKDDEYSSAPTSIDGVWTREQSHNRGVKHVMGGIFNLSYLNHKTRFITHHMIGVLMEEKGKIKEKARFVSPNWTEFLNRKRLSKFATDGPNVFTQDGVDRIEEAWIRAEANPPAVVTQGLDTFSNEPSALDGIWMFESTMGWRSLKIYDRGRFSVTHYDGNTKQVTRHMIGVYSLDGTSLKEKAIYTTENWKELQDRVFTSQVSVTAGEFFTQTSGTGDSETFRWVNRKEEETASK